jgi:hypothetical protein
MLLNEFLKEHRKNEEQQAIIAELKMAIARLTARDKEQAVWNRGQGRKLSPGAFFPFFKRALHSQDHRSRLQTC